MRVSNGNLQPKPLVNYMSYTALLQHNHLAASHLLCLHSTDVWQSILGQTETQHLEEVLQAPVLGLLIGCHQNTWTQPSGAASYKPMTEPGAKEWMGTTPMVMLNVHDIIQQPSTACMTISCCPEWPVARVDAVAKRLMPSWLLQMCIIAGNPALRYLLHCIASCTSAPCSRPQHCCLARARRPAPCLTMHVILKSQWLVLQVCDQMWRECSQELAAVCLICEQQRCRGVLSIHICQYAGVAADDHSESLHA